MKIVFFGTPDFAVPSLKRLLVEPEVEVLAIATQPDKRRGRGSQLIPSPVKQVALAHRLPVLQPQRIKQDQPTLAELKALAADFFVVVAYGQILSPEILAMPRWGCINNHGSLLPKYRGAAPIQWAIHHGQTTTGITTMLMDAGMDTGAMLLKASLEIGLLENAAEVGDKLAEIGAELIIQTLRGLQAGQIEPVPQDSTQATYAPLIKKADYELDWSKSAIALHNQIRGFYPDCLTQFRGSPLKIMATAPLASAAWANLPLDLQTLAAEWSEPGSADPGTIVGIAKNVGPIVQTGEGYLLLRQVQPMGKRLQSGSDFANGMRLQVGEKLLP
ncbi:MAG: methionyl-tRNA formyltransferase [Aphanocapsa sp. GSE-SYN-MK-11-07L]|jgi:methionyl-tRNA formyltransferase|nr:methionyl-tRNA formyltransferase [Aphanocapsa sp. GSE-SYN-MK-11-07L]